MHNLYRTFKKLSQKQKELDLEGKTDEIWDEGEEAHTEAKRLTKVAKMWQYRTFLFARILKEGFIKTYENSDEFPFGNERFNDDIKFGLMEG